MKLIIARVWTGRYDCCVIFGQIILETSSQFLCVMYFMYDYAMVNLEMNKPGTEGHDDK